MGHFSKPLKYGGIFERERGVRHADAEHEGGGSSQMLTSAHFSKINENWNTKFEIESK